MKSNKGLILLATALAFLIFAQNSLAAPICGNGVCEGSENMCSCAADCGDCEAYGSDFRCKTFTCEDNKCVEIVALDCCGNNLCEDSEDFTICRPDCPTPKEFILTPLWEDYYLRGEAVNLKIQIDADSVRAIGADVTSSGIFGELEMYDDGNHGDEEASDGIFSNSFTITRDMNEGTHPITFNVGMLGTETAGIAELDITPRLDLEINSDRMNYFLGETVKLDGKVARRGSPIITGIEIRTYSNEKMISYAYAESNFKGEYATAVRLATIDPAGEWFISAKARDEFNNWQESWTQINVEKPLLSNFLRISLNPELTGSFRRGGELKVTVDIADTNSDPVLSANVELVAPNGDRKKLGEIRPGTYSGIYTIPWKFGSGQQRFEIVAKKQAQPIQMEGSLPFIVPIEETGFITELIEPKQSTFMLGDDIEFRIKMNYPSGEAVTESIVNATINGTSVEMQAVGEGEYRTVYFVGDRSLKKVEFAFNASDAYGNVSDKSVELEVSGVSLNYYAMRFPSLFYAILFAGGLLAVLIVISKLETYTLENLKRKEIELRAEKKDIETRYFKLGTLEPETFEKMRSKIKPQLEEVREKILKMEESLEKRKKVFGRNKK